MDKINKLVVYTVLIGDKEELGSPLSLLNNTDDTDLELDFICFTDNKNLTSDTWKFVYLENTYLPSEKLSRRPKALAHEYLSDWSYSLYIDNIVTFKRLPQSTDLITEQPYLFKVFLHAFRENLLQEADAIAMLGYEDVNIIGKQLDFYESVLPIDSIHPIHTCTVILREHFHPDVIRHGTLWWENFLCFSKRDQMSFDFAIKQSGCIIDAFPGFKHENDIINGTNNAHDNRIKANFDATKYAWINRKEPEAKNNPKAHYLANTHASGEDYAKHINLFEHICHRYRSSLGQSIAPRRKIANIFDSLLTTYRGKQGNSLLVRIRDQENSQEFLEEEFVPAAQSLSLFLHPYAINTLEIGIDEISETENKFSRMTDFFDAIILFGLRPEKLSLSIEKFIGLLNHEQGILIILVSGYCDINLINKASFQMSDRFSRECHTSVNYSHHDNLSQPIQNSLLCFKWD
ncbi:MAG: DUF616 domain-containing protein [Gammaproteobacteria bacterium]|nr:DUF616 domain-containing protein [Gammaproteobacteria bacterium]